MDFQGFITWIWPVEVVGKKELQKLSFVIETKAKYPNSVLVDLYGDRIKEINGKNVGDEVIAELTFKMRQFEDRRYNGISAYRVYKLGEENEKRQAKMSQEEWLPF